MGRGLGALMSDAELVREQISGIADIELDKIDANPYQPRTAFDEEKLQEMAASIREIGLIQPVTLRKTDDGRYQIITGERRVRAALIAGLTRIPAYIREAGNDSMLEMALVENIQREDLNPVEIALSYQRLIEECSLTQETLSSRVGKNRSTIANYLRLLRLPAPVQKGLRDQLITMGHAKALISLDDAGTQLKLFGQILRQGWSVRRIEEIVRGMTAAPRDNEENAPETGLPARFSGLRKLLDRLFPAARLTVSEKGKGKILISFRSEEELRQIVKILEKLP